MIAGHPPPNEAAAAKVSSTEAHEGPGANRGASGGANGGANGSAEDDLKVAQEMLSDVGAVRVLEGGKPLPAEPLE